MAGRDKSIMIKKNISDKELDKYYSECYATLFLAINEDTGLVPLESFSYGKPVISVNEGGPREFIVNEVNGLLVSADPKEIANALDKISDKRVYKNLVYGVSLTTKLTAERTAEIFDKYINLIIENNK